MSITEESPPPAAGRAAPGTPLEITRLRLTFRALDTIQLPDYAGSTWRGALGQALRRVVCVCPGMECATCMLRESCWYARLYETAVNERCKLLAGYRDAPHPMVPVADPPGGECAAGTRLVLALSLFGVSGDAAPFLVQAARRLAGFGLGRGRGRLELESWDLDSPDHDAGGPWLPPECLSSLWLQFDTPLRLRVRNRILGPTGLAPRPFFTALLRRLYLLACTHGGGGPDLDFKMLSQQAERVAVVRRELHWYRWSRYSSRQERHVDMDGLTGRIALDLRPAPILWPYLWAGQWLHVGKGASMGMGRYRITACEPRSPMPLDVD